MTDSAAVPLSSEDRAILDLECAWIAGHTCKIVVLGEGAPGVDELRGLVAERIAAVPELTRRLGGAAEQPLWVPDEDFDVDRHVRLSDLGPAPDRDAELDEIARLFEQRLDRARPLWAIDVVPRAGGGSVLVWRIHHALADGTAAMRFARELLWDEPEQQAGLISTRSRPDQPREDHERRRRHLAAMIEREFAESARRSPFDGAIGTTRRIAFASVPMAPLHDAAKELADATLNDAVLAIVAGSLRRWLEAHHGSLRGIRVRVPVSLHHEGDSAANLDSFFSLRLPLSVADPVERLRTVHLETGRRKAGHDAEELRAFLEELGSASPRMRVLAERIERSPRSFALSVSNVPGPREPVSVLGAPVEAIHSIAEIGERHALRVAVVSLAGELHFGFCADPAIVDDLDAMAAGVVTESELLAGA